jgi:hypothetical protein
MGLRLVRLLHKALSFAAPPERTSLRSRGSSEEKDSRTALSVSDSVKPGAEASDPRRPISKSLGPDYVSGKALIWLDQQPKRSHEGESAR